MTRSAAGLRPGDIVKRPKGPVTHVGVVLDGGLVLHNTPERGEHVSTLAEFSRGRPVRVERPDDSERLRLLASATASARSRRYHLLQNNCEHTLYRARDGRPRSPQVLSWTLGIAGAVAGTLLLRHWGATAAGWELGRRLGRRRMA
ncbi:MAG TPA: hypothetical protein VLA56_13030 [Pseudomonadales bacterium]|nr:hypothetical protein [Pseudomonadales bacterium]